MSTTIAGKLLAFKSTNSLNQENQYLYRVPTAYSVMNPVTNSAIKNFNVSSVTNISAGAMESNWSNIRATLDGTDTAIADWYHTGVNYSFKTTAKTRVTEFNGSHAAADGSYLDTLSVGRLA